MALFWAHFGVLYGVSGALRSIKLGLQIRAFLGQVCPKKKLPFVIKKRRMKPSCFAMVPLGVGFFASVLLGVDFEVLNWSYNC